jgi:hypothetical protein
MGRRTSGQTTGLQSIGNVQGSAGTLSTSQTNQDLTLDPNGTGAVNVNGDILVTGDLTMANQGDLRLREAIGNGTNYIAMQAAANMAANYTITWPAAVSSTAGFVLSSDASGNLSWSSAGGNIPVSDPGASATVHYPFFGTSSGSLPTTLVPNARTNLQFVPSTGELTSTIGSFANVYGSTANSGTVTIRGTSSATKATASVLLTDNVASSSTITGTLVVTGGMGVSGRISGGSAVIEGTVNALVTDTTAQTSNYTLALTDRDQCVLFTNSADATVTVPPDSTAFPVGSVVHILRAGAGKLTLAAGAGVTLSKTGTFAASEQITIRKRASNSWQVIDGRTLLLATSNTPAVAAGFNVHTYTASANLVV